MIEIKELTHKLGGKTVLKDIGLTVPDNTVLGIVGINGAGKSTLLRLLAGVYTPDTGSVLYDGIPATDAEARQRIFFLPDDPYNTAHSTPSTLFDFYKTLYPDIDRNTYESLLAKYSIGLKAAVRNFSKGMRRQTFIALALAVRPKYLLLDEAFDGLDPLSRKIFKDAIISLVDETGCTVLISSHSLRELEDFCDKFILIDSNIIKSQGDISEHVGALCKFELAFAEAPDRAVFEGLPLVSLSLRGKFVQIVLRGDAEEMKASLEALSPLVMERFELDFEEAFIHDVAAEEDI